MTGNRLAKRYAKALALTLSDAREYRRLSGELAAVSQLLATNRQLQMALETPLISAAQKKEIVALIQENFPGSPKTHRFLQILAEENRLLLLPAILTELEGLVCGARH